MRQLVMTQPRARGQDGRVIAALICICVLYLFTLPGNHTESEDSLRNVWTLNRGILEDIFVPNHVLDGSIYYALWQSMRFLGYEGNIEVPIIIINLLASLAALVVLARIMTRLGFPINLQLLCLAAVASAYGYWLNTAAYEIYVLPMPFLLLALHTILVMHEQPKSWRHIFSLALLMCVVVLLHQQHVLFGLVVVVGLVAVFYPLRHEVSWTGIAARIAVVGFVSIALVLLTYYMIGKYVLGLDGFSEIVAWMQGAAATGKWGYWSLLGPLKAIVGFGRALVGGHFVFAIPVLSDILSENILRDYQLEEEMFMMKDFSVLVGFTLLALVLGIAAALIFLLVRIARRRTWQSVVRSGEYQLAARSVLVVSVAYLLIYGTFNLWWEPQNNELWTSLIPFVVLTLALLSLPLYSDRKIRFAFGLIVAGLFVTNFVGSILPQQSRERDYWVQFNKWFLENAGPGDLLVSGAGFISDGYLLLYTGAESLGTWDEGEHLEQKFQEILASRKPRRIFFSSTVLTPPQGITRRFNVDVSHAQKFFNDKREHLRLVHADEWQQVFLYTPPE
jgi:hypothetical protein